MKAKRKREMDEKANNTYVGEKPSYTCCPPIQSNTGKDSYTCNTTRQSTVEM